MKQGRTAAADVDRLAGMMDAMGAPQRLRIMRLLLAAHPEGMPAGEIQAELEIPASTLSHHLDKLRQASLVRVRREGTYLWYSADTEALEDLLSFLYAECCTRTRVIEPEAVTKLSGPKCRR
jgi:DNA-binding transcriptional ArsR family regulator